MIDRLDVVREARAWLGTPWRHQGRRKGIGVDCVGFIAEVARSVGLMDVQEAANYRRRPNGQTLRSKLDAYLIAIQPQDLRAADVVLLATHETPDHVGLIGDYPVRDEVSLIHAYLPARKVIEHRIDATWAARIVGAYRIPGVL